MPVGFDEAGFAVLPAVLSEKECEDLIARLEEERSVGAGTRNLLAAPWCRELARSLRRLPALAAYLPAEAVAVQCTLFAKSPDRNWLVPLHQDLSIPVAPVAPVAAAGPDPGCTGWSEKEGVLYTQPPVAVLENLLAVRLHLDACGPDNGPLRVVPGSHRLGRLGEPALAACRQGAAVEECPVPRGGLLLLRPLLLHGSSKARAASPRRVLHFLFGPRQPAGSPGLRWHDTVED